MGDQPRCSRCGGDRLAVTMTETEMLCAKCSGQPSFAERFKELECQGDESMARQMRQAFEWREK